MVDRLCCAGGVCRTCYIKLSFQIRNNFSHSSSLPPLLSLFSTPPSASSFLPPLPLNSFLSPTSSLPLLPPLPLSGERRSDRPPGHRQSHGQQQSLRHLPAFQSEAAFTAASLRSISSWSSEDHSGDRHRRDERHHR